MSFFTECQFCIRMDNQLSQLDPQLTQVDQNIHSATSTSWEIDCVSALILGT